MMIICLMIIGDKKTTSLFCLDLSFFYSTFRICSAILWITVTDTEFPACLYKALFAIFGGRLKLSGKP